MLTTPQGRQPKQNESASEQDGAPSQLSYGILDDNGAESQKSIVRCSASIPAPAQVERLGQDLVEARQSFPPNALSDPLDVSSYMSVSNSAVSLETILSCITAAELARPSEVRTILPGLALPVSGNEDHSNPGQLSVLRTPQGLDLKEAFQRLSSRGIHQGYSQSRPGQSCANTETDSVQTSPRANTPLNTPMLPTLAATVQSEPAEDGQTASPLSPLKNSGHPLQLPVPDSPNTGVFRTACKHVEYNQHQSLLSWESSAKENFLHKPEDKNASGSANNQLGCQDGLSEQVAAPQQSSLDLAEGRHFQRHWTVDGSLPLEDLRADSLTAQWRSRSALRMWPMLAPFVPRLLREDVLLLPAKPRAKGHIFSGGRRADSDDTRPPCIELFQAAILIADISGFTALTEALSTKGSAGVELLTKCVNQYFSQVIELLLQYDGDIMKFAGDSIIVAFRPIKCERDDSDGGLHAATLRAATCASELANRFGEMRMTPLGEAIPVPKSEITVDQEYLRPDAQWYEDAVCRARTIFLPVLEQPATEHLRPAVSSIQGAAKPVGDLLRGAAKPVGAVLHGTAGPFKAAVNKGSSVVSSGCNAAPKVIGNIKSFVEGKAGHSAIFPASSMKRSRSAADIPSASNSQKGVSDSAGMRETSNMQLGGQLTSSAAWSGVSDTEGTDAGLVASNKHGEPDQLYTLPPSIMQVGVRRSQSDILAALRSAAAETIFQGTPISVRPPQLPRRSEEAPSSFPGAAQLKDLQQGGQHTFLADDVYHEELREIESKSLFTSHVISPESKRKKFQSDYCPSSSGASYSSSQTSPLPLTPGAAGLYQSRGLPPIHTRAIEGREMYDVLTVSALNDDDRRSDQPSPISMQTFVKLKAAADKFRWSGRLGKILKQAGIIQITKSPLHSSAVPQSREPSFPASGGKAYRTSSAISTGSGVSALESLAALSQRVVSSGATDLQGSPPSSPGRRFLRRHILASLQSRSLSSNCHILEDNNKLSLSLKVMLSAGMVCAYHVGGGQQSSDSRSTPQWEFFVGDPPETLDTILNEQNKTRHPLMQLSMIESLAKSGEVVLSQEVASLLKDDCKVCSISTEASLLLEVLSPFQQTSTASDALEQEMSILLQLPEAMQNRALQVLRMHLLENVRLRIEAGHIDYVNEIRVCTVLFLGFPSLNNWAPDASQTFENAAQAKLAKVQQAVEVVQKKMRQLDGSLLQFRCDEKGFLAICAFGLPGRSHEDGPARGVLAALAIAETMKKRGGQAVIGVTTGRLFCAMVGSIHRLEYTVFGDAINLAARLMVKAKGGLAAILCDKSTQALAEHTANYHALNPLHVKGKRFPVDVFAVSNQQIHRRPAQNLQSLRFPLRSPNHTLELPNMMLSDYSATIEPAPTASPMIGRDVIFIKLVDRVQNLVQNLKGGAVVLEGDAGMGKTRLVEELQRSELGGMYYRCNMFIGYGRADRKSQAFYPWRRILREMFVHDRAFGQLYCLRDRYSQQPHVVITELGQRLGEASGDYGTWIHLVADALDMPLSDFPVPPPFLHKPLGMLSANIEYSTPEAPFVGEPSAVLEDKEHSFIVDASRPRSFATRIKRSVSATFATMRSPQRMHTPTRLPPRPETPMTLDTNMTSLPSSGISSPALGVDQLNSAIPNEAFWVGSDNIARAATAREFPQLARNPFGQEKEISSYFKARKVQDLLEAIILRFADAYGPLIVVVEDLHFFDSSSWKLLGAVLEKSSHHILCISTSRPFLGKRRGSSRSLGTKEVLANKIEAMYRQMLLQPSTLYMKLQPLDVDETKQLINCLLGGAEISSNVAQLVWEKSWGLPSYVQQLVVYLKLLLKQTILVQQTSALHEASVLVAGAREAGFFVAGARLSSASGQQAVLNAMDNILSTVTIHSTITDRLDQLRPEEQLVIKMASVAGLVIYLDLLQLAHPQQPSRQQVEGCLHGLEGAEFMVNDTEEPLIWRFCQVLARDVVYDLIPVSLRRDWHGRLAFVMEMMQAEHSLPSSTIAYHWTESCKSVETAQWWRTMKAIEFWEKSALEATRRAAYADGLHLLQKAQDLATLVADYFGTDKDAVAQKLAEVTSQEAVSTVPSGLVEHPSGSSLESLHGSAAYSAEVSGCSAPATSPLVPQVQRVHWERCMAAMSVASEVSSQSLNQALLHCLRALLLLNVPMPWDWRYQKKRRWWKLTFDAFFVAGMCCCSSSAPSLAEASINIASPRVAGVAEQQESEQMIAFMAQRARPGLRDASMSVPPSLLVQKGQEQIATGLFPGGVFAPTPAASYARESEAGGTPAAAAANYMQWWQQTHVRRSTVPLRAEEPEELAGRGADHGEGPEQGKGQDVQLRMPGVTVRDGLKLQSPFSSNIQHAQHTAVESAATLGASKGPDTTLQAKPSGNSGMDQAETRPQSLSERGIDELLCSHESSAQQQQLAGCSNQYAQPLGSVLLTNETQSSMQLNVQSCTGEGFADCQPSPAALEASMVLEILSTVLLMPQQLDLESLCYVMWVCKYLQGNRVQRGSLYYKAWISCAHALHHHRRQSASGVFTLKPLTSMVGFVLQKKGTLKRAA